MIAKHIRNHGPNDSFRRLAGYVVGAQNRSDDPTRWRLADYILDEKHVGEKVASVRVTHCISADPGWATKECITLAAQNTRSKRDRSYHLVVSFPEGEQPTPEQMTDIEDEIVRSIGFEDHKRISAIHQNTENWHLHIAICTVHPQTLRNVSPFYDHLRMQETCEALELKHGLIRDNHTRGPEQPLNGKPGAIKAHADRVAFAKWVEEKAGDDIRRAIANATTWSALHQALGPFGLVIKPRGAGLVMAHHANDKIRIKASDVERGMSMKNLVQRLGPYEAPAEILKAQDEYVSQVPDPTPATERLWDRYKAHQMSVITTKTVAMAELRDKHGDERRKLSAFHEWRWNNLQRQDLMWANRLRSQRVLAADKKADRQKLRARHTEERAELKAWFLTMAWDDYVGVEAGHGNRAALDVIERKMRAEARERSLVERNVQAVRSGRDGLSH